MTSKPACTLLKEFITLAQAFHILLKQLFAPGEITSDWLKKNTCALFKKGKRTDLGNYSPVLLTTQVSKLLEHFILPELLAFCNDY